MKIYFNKKIQNKKNNVNFFFSVLDSLENYETTLMSHLQTLTNTKKVIFKFIKQFCDSNLNFGRCTSKYMIRILLIPVD